ncbi:TetR/AcrR family transcriptional regulator [Paenibacillus sp. Aloe-11]|uniref:TetR/AcrR family transcriptional regulator n=1 Tax=Paenibacillus sp. Aloe-11 TaxID=1050222 RepID=UPI00024EF84B|nr:TetR/AcrR family transcriptional regulator [Paenibacillus sp. Aloe-11]EHS58389.1 TetR family transcriptional regulator [Paenibacillus sp. Aloe-11]
MKNNTKAKIKKVAEELIIKKGYRDTTVQDIATSAKVAVGTIYRYYKSKDDILMDIGRLDLKDVSYSQDIRRKEIIEAALNVFGTKGYSRTNIEDITNEIGMSKGAIYQYFKNKEELFISTIRETSQKQMLFKLTKLEQETVSIEEFLVEIGMVFLSVFEDPRKIKLMRIIIGETPNFPEIGELFYHEVVEKASEQIGKMLKPHVSNEIDPVLSIRLFIGSIWSFVIFQEMVPMKDRKYENEAIIQHAIRVFQHGIIPTA